jgi:xanthine/uracil/vitamin C permease (AzgA family)
MVVIPYRGNIIHLLKLLPTSFVDSLGSILGVTRQMDAFEGKGSIEARIPGIDVKKIK